MKEYIEKDTALETTYEPFTMSMCMTVPECNGMNRAREMIFKQLRDIPTADVVEVRHGRWIVCDDLFGEIGHCSACGFFMNVNEPGNGLPDIENLKYCPNCGAKMDGGVNDG